MPLELALQESVDEVLEKMFFVRGLDEPAPSAGKPELHAHLTFEGNPSGWLALRVSVPAARLVAADFLGEEEADLSERQVGEVVCELANMICGAVLSRVESTATFRLAAPELIPPGGEVPPNATIRAVEIDGGSLVAIFNTDTPAWPIAEKHAS